MASCISKLDCIEVFFEINDTLSDKLLTACHFCDIRKISVLSVSQEVRMASPMFRKVDKNVIASAVKQSIM